MRRRPHDCARSISDQCKRWVAHARVGGRRAVSSRDRQLSGVRHGQMDSDSSLARTPREHRYTPLMPSGAPPALPSSPLYPTSPAHRSNLGLHSACPSPLSVPFAVASRVVYAHATLATGDALPGAWPSLTTYRRDVVAAIVTVDPPALPTQGACPAMSPALLSPTWHRNGAHEAAGAHIYSSV